MRQRIKFYVITSNSLWNILSGTRLRKRHKNEVNWCKWGCLPCRTPWISLRDSSSSSTWELIHMCVCELNISVNTYFIHGYIYTFTSALILYFYTTHCIYISFSLCSSVSVSLAIINAFNSTATLRICPCFL